MDNVKITMDYNTLYNIIELVRQHGQELPTDKVLNEIIKELGVQA